jgi:hypothetical protein
MRIQRISFKRQQTKTFREQYYHVTFDKQWQWPFTSALSTVCCPTSVLRERWVAVSVLATVSLTGMLRLPEESICWNFHIRRRQWLSWIDWNTKNLLLRKDFSVLHPPISTPSVLMYSPSSTLLHSLLSLHTECYTYFLSWCHQWLVLGLIQLHIQFVPEDLSPLVQQPGDEADHSPQSSTKAKNDAIPNSPTCLFGMHKDNNTLLFITNIKQAHWIQTR